MFIGLLSEVNILADAPDNSRFDLVTLKAACWSTSKEDAEKVFNFFIPATELS